MTAFLVDPVATSLNRIVYSGEAGPEDPLLLGAAVEEGACGQDFVACARLLAGTDNGFKVNAYTLWENNRGRAVLFVGNITPEDRHGFRIGRPGKAVKSTVFFGKGVVLRYEKTQLGFHRTYLLSGSLGLVIDGNNSSKRSVLDRENACRPKEPLLAHTHTSSPKEVGGLGGEACGRVG